MTLRWPGWIDRPGLPPVDVLIEVTLGPYGGLRLGCATSLDGDHAPLPREGVLTVPFEANDRRILDDREDPPT
jgi:hypothetical protein